VSFDGRLFGNFASSRRFGILERDAAENLVLSNWVKRGGASRANAQEGDWVVA